MPRSDATAAGVSLDARRGDTLAAMRSLRRTLLWAAAAGLLLSCSVNQSGLTDDGGVHADGGTGTGGSGAPAGQGGTGGSVSSTGSGGAAGTIVTGTAGNPGNAGRGGSTTAGLAGTTGAAGAGAAGKGGAGDGSGSAGTTGAGDATGTAGVAGAGNTAGTNGVAGADGGASAGSGGAGAVVGTGGGGVAGGAGMSGGRGGFGGNATGNAGRGGFGGNVTGTAGRGGTGGRGGSSGNPCTGYPANAKAFVTPTDNRTHCYWPRFSSQTWSEAQQSCTLQNGYLVTILSAEENAFVVSVAQFSGTFDDTWIGATDGKLGSDKSGAGTYKWISNEAWGYSNWEQGQPDGFCDPCSLGQTCTCDHRAVLSNNGTWNDRWQDNMRSSVCEATPN